jgi:hypothetical protein
MATEIINVKDNETSLEAYERKRTANVDGQWQGARKGETI